MNRVARCGGVTVAVAGLSLLLAACSSSSPSHVAAKEFGQGQGSITLFSYDTGVGHVVGTIDGIVAYTDTAESAHHFQCTTRACVKTWRPWVTYGAKVKAGVGVQQSLIGTVKRPDGSIQLSYGGHPLYFYSHSKNAVQANAQGAGGVWYVLGTDGNVIK